MIKTCRNCLNNQEFSDVLVNGVLLRDPQYCQRADEMLPRIGNAVVPVLDDRDVDEPTDCPYWEDADENE
ncbi:hypothetical protein Dthio_PD3623 [Desulfonatronospira thiodismutans ASO3-1]|uniref:Uncharacterized protein n=1 Tax=Desulfonatronospira thiodismutans ASO3-1 TaxID=555779 RepID=D6SJW4_9BACT|nr:hypothetical protein [Desulfonatronospira thiodismutans]EFI36167.1 hypothetical protein Dthio_PD3623 [Desulfonatronospira thiodismutans ASO3-1]